MKAHRLIPAAAIAALAISPLVRADELTLKDGSVLKGKITAIEDGAFVFKSVAVADPVKVKQTDILSFSTDGDIFVGTASQTVVKGKIEAAAAGSVKVTTPEGVSVIRIDNIRDGWTPGSPSPAERALEKLKRHWEYTADIAITGKTGNRESVGESSGLQALNKSPEDETKFYLKHNYAKTKGPLGWSKSADDLHAGVDYTSYFARPFFWYARTDNGYDKVKYISFFSTSALGVGDLLIDKDYQHLSVRGGFSYRYEAYQDFTGRSDTSAPGLDLGIHHDCEFKYFKMVNDLSYTPSINDFNDCIILHDSYIEMPFANTDVWKLRMGVSNEYRSKVVSGVDRLDTTYYLKFVLNWK